MALRPNGSRKWAFAAGREIRSSPAVSNDGTVYFGCRDRKCYAVGSDGKKIWEFKTGAWVDSSPALGGDGTVFIGSWDKNFYAIGHDGAQKWQFKTAGPVVSSAAIGADEKIYFGSHDGRFYALSPDGHLAWQYVAGGPIVASPAIDKDGTFYFTSLDGFFYALNPGGDLKWRLRTGGITGSSPVIGQDETIYVGVNKRLLAISREGKQKWQQEISTDEYRQPIDATPLVLADDSLCIVAGYGLLLALDRTRHYKWSFSLQGHGHASPAVDVNGTVYIAGQIQGVGYFFYAVAGEAQLGKSPWPRFRGNERNTGHGAP